MYDGYDACSSSVQGELHAKQSSRLESGNGISGVAEVAGVLICVSVPERRVVGVEEVESSDVPVAVAAFFLRNLFRIPAGSLSIVKTCLWRELEGVQEDLRGDRSCLRRSSKMTNWVVAVVCGEGKMI